jgi:hypothetical protein
MRTFTDSPYERMMMQRPNSGREKPEPLPKNHPCYGCGSYGGGCFALCHKKLNSNLRKQEER